jgi:hypothetical protein
MPHREEHRMAPLTRGGASGPAGSHRAPGLPGRPRSSADAGHPAAAGIGGFRARRGRPAGQAPVRFSGRTLPPRRAGGAGSGPRGVGETLPLWAACSLLQGAPGPATRREGHLSPTLPACPRNRGWLHAQGATHLVLDPLDFLRASRRWSRSPTPTRLAATASSRTAAGSEGCCHDHRHGPTATPRAVGGRAGLSSLLDGRPDRTDGRAGVPLRSRGRGQNPETPEAADLRRPLWRRPALRGGGSASRCREMRAGPVVWPAWPPPPRRTQERRKSRSGHRREKHP